MKLNYNWTLKDAVFTKDKGKVFSCFACGGGSAMGYKLAGFDVIGHNDIDLKMVELYKLNHNPKFSFLESITTFAKRKDLPKELYDLDILDGSPPCSSFSVSGNREKDWGKEKKFAEGQEMQVLDTLFFDFIDLAKELQPKIVIAENVKGLLLGGAKKYVVKICKEFDKAGYVLQHFLLDSSNMGVPQKRERVFFIAMRKDLITKVKCFNDLFTTFPLINLDFHEREILGEEIFDYKGKSITEHCLKAWNYRMPNHTRISQCKANAGMKESNFNCKLLFKTKVISTITSKGYHGFIHYDKPIYISDNEMMLAGSYPLDYNHNGMPCGYVIGMSVPPVMMANIAIRVSEQWLSKINIKQSLLNKPNSI